MITNPYIARELMLLHQQDLLAQSHGRSAPVRRPRRRPRWAPRARVLPTLAPRGRANCLPAGTACR